MSISIYFLKNFQQSFQVGNVENLQYVLKLIDFLFRNDFLCKI